MANTMSKIEKLKARLKKLYPDFDDAAFADWWVTGQPLLGGKSPDQAPFDEVESLVSAAEKYHASN
jgi:hypothetical protein